MNLTRKQKTQLREIFQRAQDILTINSSTECYCCHAIDLAEGLRYGDGRRNNTLADRYFCELFMPENEYPPAWLCWPEAGFEKQQYRRLMALQLCELSLS